MSDFGLQSDGYDLDLDPNDLADPDAVYGHGVAAGLGAADDTAASPSGGSIAGDVATAGYDSDGDGTVDVLVADENHDGATDIAMWDTNHDGLIDQVAYDQDYDGEVDRVESADGNPPGYTSN